VRTGLLGSEMLEMAKTSEADLRQMHAPAASCLDDGYRHNQAILGSSAAKLAQRDRSPSLDSPLSRRPHTHHLRNPNNTTTNINSNSTTKLHRHYPASKLTPHPQPDHHAQPQHDARTQHDARRWLYALDQTPYAPAFHTPPAPDHVSCGTTSTLSRASAHATTASPSPVWPVRCCPDR